MNLKNLAMWGIIVLLSVGLFNMFQNPNKMGEAKTKIGFSEFGNPIMTNSPDLNLKLLGLEIRNLNRRSV